MKAVRIVLTLAVSFVIVGNLCAQEEKKGPEGKRPHQAMMERWAMLKGVNLTDAQKAQVEAVKQEYAPKFKETHAAIDGILTEEQRNARAEAVKAANAAGKHGPEVWKDAQAAATLTDEQKAKMAEARKAAGALHKEAREEILAIPTPEQKDQLKKPRDGKHGRPEMGRGDIFKDLDLSDEQKAQVAELRKEYAPKIEEAGKGVGDLRKEMHEKVLAVLTPDQKEQLKQKREQRKGHKPEGK